MALDTKKKMAAIEENWMKMGTMLLTISPSVLGRADQIIEHGA